MKTAITATIPKTILNNFLDSKIGYKDSSRITATDCNLLWTSDNIDRFRVDVWTEEYNDKLNLDIQKIAYSYFMHFDRDAEVLIDKTINK
jgi:hypothetical protein